ncbi:sigma-70 family RNA polymerase sigma factor [Sphingobium sp.]|uniref:sigma-70 family RNA polymerase sigma factor n=1 Tax=Sphingobium sp. TaxID=1912891 RepID=UPI002C03601C|nr:sigma-70 family RNA polymerase sigma factor [Sphingobium sp.]HUD94855.1 sigma-70 family RNA polymerase sigma factor [Sphingobium sp.]
MQYSQSPSTARAALVDALRSAGAKDQSALRLIYDMTSAKLFGICLRICCDREAAEDVLQDVYVKIWRRAASFDPARASPISWMAIIARNAALDWCRREGRHAVLPADCAPETADDAPSADTSLEDAEQKSRLLGCMEGLSDNQSATIRRIFMDGMTYQHLSDNDGTPVGTLKSWVRRGLVQLKACLGDD